MNSKHVITEPLKVSVSNLRELQLERMKKSLSHAYENVLFYKESFDAAGVHPANVNSLADLKKFPFTYKDDLRANYPFGMFAKPRQEISRIHASSGTTGKPTVVGYTDNDIKIWSNLVARSIYAAGGRPGDMVHVAYGYGLFTGGLGAHYGAEALGCTVVPMSGGNTEKQVQLIQDFKPRIIMVTPSYMLALADAFEQAGIDPRSTSLEIGIHGAEPWSEAMRQEIQSRFDIDATDIYGLSEVIGPGVGQESNETKDGAHIWEDHFYPEIIDPETGEVLEDGQEGELVFTSLTKEACPIIRYRTRDLTRLLPGTAYSMRRMDRIRGRSDDMMIIRGVNVFPTQIEGLICEDSRLAPHYYCEINRKGQMDTLTVHTELSEAISDRPVIQGLADTLQKKIKTMIGVSAKIEIGKPGTIPRSEGKAKRVIDNR